MRRCFVLVREAEMNRSSASVQHAGSHCANDCRMISIRHQVISAPGWLLVHSLAGLVFLPCW